jgi:hypothetical protein
MLFVSRPRARLADQDRPVGAGYDNGRTKRPREDVNPQFRCDLCVECVLVVREGLTDIAFCGILPIRGRKT